MRKIILMAIWTAIFLNLVAGSDTAKATAQTAPPGPTVAPPATTDNAQLPMDEPSAADAGTTADAFASPLPSPSDTILLPAAEPTETDGAAHKPAWRELTPAYSAQTPLPISGVAMYYNPGVMQVVIENRVQSGRIDPCPPCVGFVAMLRYGDLNRRIWLQLGETEFEGPFLVTDVAATHHVGQLLAKNWAVDVDYATAQRWHMKMPYVTLWDVPPLAAHLAADTLPLLWSATPVPHAAFFRPPHSRNPYLESAVAYLHDVLIRHRQRLDRFSAQRPAYNIPAKIPLR